MSTEDSLFKCVRCGASASSPPTLHLQRVAYAFALPPGWLRVQFYSQARLPEVACSEECARVYVGGIAPAVAHDGSGGA